MPRPRKFTPERAARVLQAISAGNHKAVAARLAGVHPETVGNWLKEGEKAKSGQLFEFFEGFTRAEAEAEARAVVAWQRAMPDDWRASRDFLARRFPERWADKTRHELTGAGGGPIQTETLATDPDLSVLTVEELIALEAINAKLSGSAGDQPGD